MSISKHIAMLLMLAAGVAGVAQQKYDLNDFTGIKSEGPIPADLRKGLGELYSEDKQRVRDYNDGKLANRDRVLEASYHINRLTSNGRILYGDPITRMVERIADTLLKDHPGLRGELRFYTVKSSSVNAFATGQGMIFVTTGLVAQVENESQLAYVISHEIVHYYRKHNMEVLTRRIKNSDDEAEQMANFLKYHYRSREMENEADSLGLRLFYIGSPYDKRVTDGVFDVLQYAMLPFDEVPFDTTYFNSPYYRLPSHYFLEKVAPISQHQEAPCPHGRHTVALRGWQCLCGDHARRVCPPARVGTLRVHQAKPYLFELYQGVLRLLCVATTVSEQCLSCPLDGAGAVWHSHV